MSVSSFARRALLAVLVLLFVLLGLSALIVVTGVTIPLDAVRGPVADAASEALGRKVAIDGSVSLVPTLWPTIQIEGFQIANPEPWDSAQFARVDRVRAQVGLRPLLRGELHIGELTAEDVTLLLESTADGRRNWDFGARDVSKTSEAPTDEQAERPGVAFVALDQLELRSVKVSYRDGTLNQTYAFALDEFVGAARVDEPVDARIRGSLQDKPYSFALKGGAVSELLNPGQPWELRLTGEAAGSPVVVEGRRTPTVERSDWALDVTVEQVDIGGLLSWLALVEDVEAATDRLQLRAVVRGESLYQVLDESEFSASLSGARWTLRDPGTQAAATIHVREGVLGVEPGQPWTMRLDGVLEDAPVTIGMRGARLVELANPTGPLPLELDARIGEGQLKMEGAVTLPISVGNLALKASLSGERLDRFGSLIRVDLPPIGPYAVGGQFRVEEDGYHLSDIRVRVQESELTGAFNLRTTGVRPRFEADLTATRLQLDHFDVGEWSPLAPEVSGEQASDAVAPGDVAAEEQGENLLSPEVLAKFDGRLSVTVGEVLAGADSYGGGSLLMTLEEGRLTLDPLRLDTPVGGVTARLALVPTEEQLKSALDITVERADIGGLLAGLGLAEGIDASTERLEFHGQGKGQGMRDLLTNSEFSATLTGARWTLRDPGTQASATIQVQDGSLGATPGQPVTVKLKGLLETTPIVLELQGARLVDLAQGLDRAPLALRAQVAGANLEMQGDVALPVSRGTLQVAASLSGERLDGWNTLLDLDLPPLGPYVLGGQFRMGDEGYDLSDFQVRVGQSELTGAFALRTRFERPRIDVKLIAPRLQLDDFATDDWSPVEGRKRRRPEAPEQPPPDSGDAIGVEELLSPEALRRFDGRLALRVDEVLSGKDSLGGGTMSATLQAGRLAVEPLQLDIPGGAMRLAFALEPRDEYLEAQVNAHVEGFDYGVLARRVKPESGMSGTFSLDVDLHSQAPTYDELMQYADGHFDFGIWPGNFEADVFELWAVSLAAAVLPRVDSSAKSVVNCFVLRLNMEDGVMNQEALLVDTTRMQVQGEARIDFKEQDIYLHLRPQAKRPQFFSLATPVRVEGHFSDFGLGVRPGELIGSVINLLTSPIHVPLRRMAVPADQRPPADGRAACEAALHRSDE